MRLRKSIWTISHLKCLKIRILKIRLVIIMTKTIGLSKILFREDSPCLDSMKRADCSNFSLRTCSQCHPLNPKLRLALLLQWTFLNSETAQPSLQQPALASICSPTSQARLTEPVGSINPSSCLKTPLSRDGRQTGIKARLRSCSCYPTSLRQEIL